MGFWVVPLGHGLGSGWPLCQFSAEVRGLWLEGVGWSPVSVRGKECEKEFARFPLPVFCPVGGASRRGWRVAMGFGGGRWVLVEGGTLI